MPCDNSADDEVDTADEERQCAGLTEGAAAVAEEQVKVCRQGALLTAEYSQGSCAGHDVGILGEHRGSHGAAEGQQQEDSRGDGRVSEVLTDTAEQALYDDYREDSADGSLPQGDSRRNIQCEKQTGDSGGKIPDSLFLAADNVEHEFGSHSGDNAGEDNEQAAYSENDDRSNSRRHKRDQHVKHDGACCAGRIYVRRRSNS